MEKYRGTQLRGKIQEFSPHADKTPKTYYFKKTNKGYFAEDLVKFVIEHKLASPDEVRLFSFKFEANGRSSLQRFFKYMKERIVSEDLVETNNFLQFDKTLTAEVIEDIEKLEGKLFGKAKLPEATKGA